MTTAAAIQRIEVEAGSVPLNFEPDNDNDMQRCLGDVIWRICSGKLYWILVRENEDDPDSPARRIPFLPNRSQRRMLKRLWHRNIILKARQLGFTTLICIIWLDHALFNADQRCGVIAHDGKSAATIFRDKVKFAYDNLPQPIKDAMPLKRDSADELLFDNDSSIQVAGSMRSGTLHRLLVSEFGKMCAKFPAKAEEVLTGSLPTVAASGIIVIESTAEGAEGEFYRLCLQAIADFESSKVLNRLEWRFHFFAWWANPEYEIDPIGVIISPDKHDYFDELERRIGREINLRQRAWYVSTERTYAGKPDRMWAEFPSTPKEAFQVSLAGAYYEKQVSLARQDRRITKLSPLTGTPVYSFWDIGVNDGTAVWFMQRLEMRFRFIGFIEGWGEPYATFTKDMQARGWMWAEHFLPHDATHRKQLENRIASPKEMLEGLWPGQKFTVVDRVNELQDGIQAVRDVFSQCWFDEESTAEGVNHLASYKKEWDPRVATWRDKPRKDEHTEGADAFRQFAQAWVAGQIRANRAGAKKPHRRPRSAMAA